MASQHRIRFCRCGSSSSPMPVDGGRLLCPHCGDLVPDPILLAIFKEQRKIGRQQTAMLEAIERLERGGDYSEHEQRVEETAASPNKLVTPAELAERYGPSPQWFRDHCEELGGVRLGDGPKPRYLYDPERVRARLAALAMKGSKRHESEQRPRRRRRQRKASPELLPVKGRAAA